VADRGRRAAILDAALRLSADRGLDAVSLAEVCRAAGASNGSMYHHFPTRQALQAALWGRALEGYQAAIARGLERSRSARDGIRGVVLGHVRWVLAHPDAARLLDESPRTVAGSALRDDVQARNRAFLARVGAWLRPRVAAGALRAVPMDALIAIVFAPVRAATREWLRGADARRLRRVAPILADAAWAALAPAAASRPVARRPPPA
jgi:AcrR family transcriptional regulator